jgi:hypothetical protein
MKDAFEYLLKNSETAGGQWIINDVPPIAGTYSSPYNPYQTSDTKGTRIDISSGDGGDNSVNFPSSYTSGQQPPNVAKTTPAKQVTKDSPYFSQQDGQSLRNDVNELRQDVNSLTDRMGNLEGRVGKLEEWAQSVTPQIRKIDKIEQDVKEIKSDIKDIKALLDRK